MRRRDLLRGLVVVAALAIAPSVHADPVEDVTRQLRAQGFQVREVSRTWLGRIRVIAESDTQQREIVFDRTTGEIRRDLVTSRRPSRPAESDNRDDRSSGQSASGGGGNSGPGNSGGGGKDDDDDDDDDRGGRGGGDDDDRDDDNSGRGGGDNDDRGDDDNSGRGGGDDDDGDDDDDDD